MPKSEAVDGAGEAGAVLRVVEGEAKVAEASELVGASEAVRLEVRLELRARKRVS